MPNQSTTREAKAQQLIDASAVTLYVGQGYATVRGSQGVTYTVTKDACGCKDFQRRGGDCKHRLAAKALCAEFRQLKAAAERGERVRPSSALLAAIRWPERPKAKAGCRECGAPTDFDICSGCFFGQVAA